MLKQGEHRYRAWQDGELAHTQDFIARSEEEARDIATLARSEGYTISKVEQLTALYDYYTVTVELGNDVVGARHHVRAETNEQAIKILQTEAAMRMVPMPNGKFEMAAYLEGCEPQTVKQLVHGSHFLVAV